MIQDMFMNAQFVKENFIGKREIQNSILIKIEMGGRAQVDEEYLYIKWINDNGYSLWFSRLSESIE